VRVPLFLEVFSRDFTQSLFAYRNGRSNPNIPHSPSRNSSSLRRRIGRDRAAPVLGRGWRSFRVVRADSNARYRDRLAGRADAGFAGVREAGDVIRAVVAYRHEDALLLGVVVEMLASALTRQDGASMERLIFALGGHKEHALTVSPPVVLTGAIPSVHFRQCPNRLKASHA